MPEIKKKNPVLPTASTFIHNTTFRPNVTNLNGDKRLNVESHRFRGQKSTFGKLSYKEEVRPSRFLKKNTTKMGNEDLPRPRKFDYPDRRKEAVKKVGDKPYINIVSKVNYIKENVERNKRLKCRKPRTEVNWLRKKEYGRPPGYLERIRKRIDREREYIRMISRTRREKERNRVRMLGRREVEGLKDRLREKYALVHAEYRKFTHITRIDSLVIKRKKEECEKNLQTIQRYLRMLSNPYIFVDSEC